MDDGYNQLNESDHSKNGVNGSQCSLNENSMNFYAQKEQNLQSVKNNFLQHCAEKVTCK